MEPFITSILVIIATVTLALSYFYLKGNILFKIIPFTAFLVVSVLVYSTIEFHRGWPQYTDTLEGRVVAVIVNEEEERIYVWVHARNEQAYWYTPYIYSNPLSGRLYEIPYTEQTAEEAEQMGDALSTGKSVDINIKDGRGVEGSLEGDTGGEASSSTEMVPAFQVVSPDSILIKDE